MKPWIGLARSGQPELEHARTAARSPRPFQGSTGFGQRSVWGASRIRITFAGTPPTTAFAGTSLVTTELVPTIELSPTRHAAQDAGAVADPDVGADLDLAHVDPLDADRALDLDHPVVEVDEHRPVGDHALLADPDPPVGRDRALLAEHRLLRRSRPRPRGSGSSFRRRPRRSARSGSCPASRSAARRSLPKKTGPSVSQRQPAGVRKRRHR